MLANISAYKKFILFLNLQICQTPYGTNRHVYSDVGPYKDPDIYPFMAKMGFSLPSTKKNLIFTSGDDSEEDILAAGLIMLKATVPSPS